jgi:hypothetical protein
MKKYQVLCFKMFHDCSNLHRFVVKWESVTRRWEKSLKCVYCKRKVLNVKFWFTNAGGFRVASIQFSPLEPAHVNSVQTKFSDPLTCGPIQTVHFSLFFFFYFLELGRATIFLFIPTLTINVDVDKHIKDLNCWGLADFVI